MATSGNAAAVIAAIFFVLVILTTTGSITLCIKKNGTASLGDGRRLVLVLFFSASSLWALFGLASTFIRGNAVLTCHVTITFAAAFDQLARSMLEQYALWSIIGGYKLSKSSYPLQAALILRLIIGGVWVGAQRPNLRTSCIANNATLPLGIVLVGIDALILLSLSVMACLAAQLNGIQGTWKRLVGSESIFLVTLGMGVWTIFSIPMSLGIKSTSLTLRTVLPSVGLLLLIVTLMLVTSLFAWQTVSQRLQKQNFHRETPSPTQTSNHNIRSDSLSRIPRSLPLINQPPAGQATKGVGGLPTDGNLFPPTRTPTTTATIQQWAKTTFETERKKGSKIVISGPTLDEASKTNLLDKITTVDLSAAAEIDKDRRHRVLLSSSSSVNALPDQHHRALTPEDMVTREQPSKRKPLPRPLNLKNARNQNFLELSQGLTSATQPSPGVETLRWRSPRQPYNGTRGSMGSPLATPSYAVLTRPDTGSSTLGFLKSTGKNDGGVLPKIAALRSSPLTLWPSEFQQSPKTSPSGQSSPSKAINASDKPGSDFRKSLVGQSKSFNGNIRPSREAPPPLPTENGTDARMYGLPKTPKPAAQEAQFREQVIKSSLPRKNGIPVSNGAADCSTNDDQISSPTTPQESMIHRPRPVPRKFSMPPMVSTTPSYKIKEGQVKSEGQKASAAPTQQIPLNSRTSTFDTNDTNCRASVMSQAEQLEISVASINLPSAKLSKSEKLELSNKVQFPSFHHRVGDELPTFSVRKNFVKRSREISPPTPLKLKKPPQVIVVKAEPSPAESPLESPDEALKKIQEQLKNFGEPNEDLQATLDYQQRMTMLADLESEMGQQASHWQKLREELARDSTVMSNYSPRKSLRDSLRSIFLSAKLKEEHDTTPEIDNPSLAEDPYQERPILSNRVYQEKSVGLVEPRHPPMSASTPTGMSLLSVTNVSGAYFDNLTPPDSDEEDEIDHDTMDLRILSEEIMASPSIDNQIRDSPSFKNDQELTAAKEEPTSTLPSEDLPLLQPTVYVPEPSSGGSTLAIVLEDQSYQKEPHPVIQRPLRQEKRISLLPDILESPTPLTNNPDALGIFRFPWGERSDSANTADQFITLNGATQSLPNASAKTASNAQRPQYNLDTIIEDYDEDSLDSSDDDIDESIIWEIADLLKPNTTLLYDTPSPDNSHIERFTTPVWSHSAETHSRSNYCALYDFIPITLSAKSPTSGTAASCIPELQDVLKRSSLESLSTESLVVGNSQLDLSAENSPLQTKSQSMSPSTTPMRSNNGLWSLPLQAKMKGLGLHQPDSIAWQAYATPNTLPVRQKARLLEPVGIQTSSLWSMD